MKNSYLLIDYGNSRIKAAIYDYKANKILEELAIDNDKSLSSLLAKSKTIAKTKIAKIFFVATPSKAKIKSFVSDLKNKFKVEIKFIEKKDFKNLIDFSNVKKDVVIGNDILLQAFYGIRKYKAAAIFSLGTAYVATIVKNKQFKSVYIIPSVLKAMDNIAKQTAIASDLLPKVYNKTIGLNTNDSFSAGVNLNLYGWVKAIAKQHNINNIVISGGDCYHYSLLTKNYKVLDNVVLKALALLIKEKCW